MESGLNPFSPNAGSRPPELVGRDDVLTDAQTMIARLPRRLSVQSMLLTGVRGVGKTVLLNEVSRIAKTKDVVRKGMIGLRNFLGTVKVHYGDFGIDSGVGLLALELCPGRADYACGREMRGRRRRRQD